MIALKAVSYNREMSSCRGRSAFELSVETFVISAEDACLENRQIEAAISETVNHLQPRAIGLFYAGPVAMTVGRVHRWNALPRTQLHEFEQATCTYTATCVLV